MFKNVKKICYIQYLEDIEANIEHLSKSIYQNGFEVTIINISRTDQEVFDIIDGRKFYKIPLKGDRRKKKNIVLFIIQAIRYINKHDFDIVHIGHSPRYFSLIKILGSSKAKFIYHSLSYPISRSHFESVKQMILTFIQCLFMDRIIVQSDELKEKMIGIRSLKKANVIPVGFNKNYVYPINIKQRNRLRRLLDIDENQPLLVYCGVISKTRQLNRLLEGFRKVKKTLSDAMLLMIGDGDSLEDLKGLANTLGISKSTIFTGRVPHHEVVNYIGIGDIGISYIPINENYNYNPPLKTFEYLACGLATIATNTESNRRIIKNCFNGILVNDTPEDIENAIVNLIKNRKKLLKLAANARKSIMKNDFEYITQYELIPLYMNILGARAKPI